MTTQQAYPKVVSVRPLAGKRLLVSFANGVVKIYDCGPLLAHAAFRPLAQEALFRSVHADPHGYGVVWNDEIDLAESELWVNGKVAEPETPADADEPRR